MTTINKVELNQNDIVVFHVDIGNLPPSKANEFMEKTKLAAESKFPDNTVLVLPHKTTMTIIQKP